MKTPNIIAVVERAFSNSVLPKDILYNGVNDADRSKKVYEDIVREYGSLNRKDLTKELCAMIVADSDLLSDQTIEFFLPELARSVILTNGNAYGLLQRLDRLNLNRLTEKQAKAISDLKEVLFEQSSRLDAD